MFIDTVFKMYNLFYFYFNNFNRFTFPFFYCVLKIIFVSIFYFFIYQSTD